MSSDDHPSRRPSEALWLGQPSGVPPATDAHDCAVLEGMAAEIERTLEVVKSDEGRGLLLDLLAAYRAAIHGYAVTARCGPLRPS